MISRGRLPACRSLRCVRWRCAREVPPLALDCRHSSQRVRFKLYDQEKLIKRMETIEVSAAAKGDQ
jgi:hypothetical protein